MIHFDLLGERCELHGASYNCPALRLYGYATETKLAGAIRKRKAASRAKIDENAYGLQGRGPDAEEADL